MKTWLILLMTCVLTACSPSTPTTLPAPQAPSAPAAATSPAERPPAAAPTEPAMKSIYSDLGPAPELSGDVWLNSDAPLRLTGLRGKVVLVDMWTFG